MSIFVTLNLMYFGFDSIMYESKLQLYAAVATSFLIASFLVQTWRDDSVQSHNFK